MMNKDLHIPRIPKGCDQQGRYPEAASAANEIEDDQPGFCSWYTLTDILIASLAPGAVVLILLMLWGWV